jgi:hypothetical protein
MNVRRCAAVLAAALVLGMSTAPAALADGAPSATPSASPAHPAGLYGTSDPTYDGVFRQSYALLAQHTVGVHPAASAIDWLTRQQCDDGGFAAFRADPGAPCGAKTPVDSNSTAAAVQALTALGGHLPAVTKALHWLESVQNDDGGWGYSPGLPSDTNSTGLVIGALSAAGKHPADVRSAKGDRSPFDALSKLALPCAKGGAFGLRDAKSGKLAANADATAAGVLGALGHGLVVTAGRASASPKHTHCRDGAAHSAAGAAANGAAYLRTLLADTPYVKASLPGSKDQPDFGNTADAVVALVAAGQGDAAKAPLTWLTRHAAEWAGETGPAAYAELIFAAHAAGTDPRHFGRVDLVGALNDTGPAPQPTRHGAVDDEAVARPADGAGGSTAIWWAVGVCLVAGIGVGLLLSARRRRS